MKAPATVKCETQGKQLVEIDASRLTQRFSVYGVIIKNNRVLLVKTHSKNWELPGGTPEPGETVDSGLRRELEEETGITTLSVGNILYIRESFYLTPSSKVYHSIQLYFAVESKNSQPAQTAETTDLDFVPLKDVTPENTNTSSYLALQHILSNDHAIPKFKPWTPDPISEKRG